MVGIDRNAARSAKSFDGEWRTCTHDLDTFALGLAVCIDTQIDRHAEKIEVLRNFAGAAEAGSAVFFGLLFRLLFFRPGGAAAGAGGGLLHFELRRARRIEPLRKEPGELVAVIFLGNGLEI